MHVYLCLSLFRDNTPTDIPMTSNEWIMLAVVWNAFDKELKLYKNGELAFIINTKDNPLNPTKVMLSVKKETCEYSYYCKNSIFVSHYLQFH